MRRVVNVGSPWVSILCFDLGCLMPRLKQLQSGSTRAILNGAKTSCHLPGIDGSTNGSIKHGLAPQNAQVGVHMAGDRGWPAAVVRSNTGARITSLQRAHVSRLVSCP
jgi:hypothetical protein